VEAPLCHVVLELIALGHAHPRTLEQAMCRLRHTEERTTRISMLRESTPKSVAHELYDDPLISAGFP